LGKKQKPHNQEDRGSQDVGETLQIGSGKKEEWLLSAERGRQSGVEGKSVKGARRLNQYAKTNRGTI